MKSLLITFLLLLFAPTISMSADSADDMWRGCSFKSSTYNFKLTEIAWKKAPEWNKDQGNPPLSPQKAYKAALTQAKELRPEVTKWHLAFIRVEPAFAGSPETFLGMGWIYIVRFDDYSTSFFGVAPRLIIPVYMDGSTIQPVIEKSK